MHAVAYTVWLAVIWTAYVAWGYPHLAGMSAGFSVAIGESCRFLIFTAPLFVIFQSRSPWRALGVRIPPGRWLIGGLLVAATWAAVSLFLASRIQHRTFNGVPEIAFWFTGFSTATVIEEVSFRGYFTQQLSRYGSRFAIVASSVLFVLIHFPGWYLLNLLPGYRAYLSHSLSILLLGVALGWLFLKCGSIWPGVILHAVNNLAAALTSAGGG
ncbi:MAG: type II CAAX endopeptidase family protein [Planctomycetaceae bacterium]